MCCGQYSSALLISTRLGYPRSSSRESKRISGSAKAGIIFLGSRFLLVDVLKLGGISLVLVAIELSLSIVVMTWIGKKFGLREAYLASGYRIADMATGIIAAKGAIDADEE